MISYPASASACQTCPRRSNYYSVSSVYSSVSIRPSFHRNESKIDTVENRLEILESNYLEWKSRMISNKIPVDDEKGDIRGWEEGNVFSMRRKRGAMGKLSWSCYDTILSYLWTRDVGSNVAGDMTGAHGTECCNTPRVKNSCSSDGGP